MRRRPSLIRPRGPAVRRAPSARTVADAARWLEDHRHELARSHPHDWIAIGLAGGVAAHAPSLGELEAQVARKNLRGRVLIARVEPHGTLGL